MDSALQADQRNLQGFSSLKLTQREAEVLFWISQGKSNHDIGIILGAKTGTICKHVEHILSKLNVENRTSAAVVAIEARRCGATESESRSDQSRAAIAGVIATPLVELWAGSCEIFNALSLLVA